MNAVPELPEVETIKRIVEPQIKGQGVLWTDLRNAQIVAYPSADELQSLMLGNTITGMSRRGKFLCFCFENKDRLFLHLRMTGQLLVTPADYPEVKHTHLVIRLSGGSEIRYIDVRRFGRFWYIRHGESDAVTGIQKLGPEPTDKTLTGAYLKSALGKRQKPVKSMLHEQKVIAGIGNIYSDEILYLAGIYPGEKCSSLTEDDWQILSEKIHTVIQWGIDVNQTTPEEYLKGQGKEYRNAPYLKAYGHAGQSCEKCGAVFERIMIDGRSSTYCPNCQKKRL